MAESVRTGDARPASGVPPVRGTGTAPGGRRGHRVGRVVRRGLSREQVYGPAGLVALTVAVCALGFVAVELAPPDHGVAAWWPAAGLSVVAIAWAPQGSRRWLVVLAVVVGTSIGNLLAGRPLPVALGFGLGNAAEALVVASWLVRGGRRPQLVSLEDITRLFTATFLGVLVMGAVGGTTVWLAGGDPLVTARTVMTSHGAAILVIAPLGLRALRPRKAGRGPEAVAAWTAVIGVTVTVFRVGQDLPLSFLPIPFLVWGALRLGVRTVGGQLVATALIVTWANRNGGGPFAEPLGAGSTAATSLVQAYLVVCAMVTLPLAVSVAQRRAALERVAASERLFRQGFSDALLGMLLLRRCEPGHADLLTGERTAASGEHVHGGLDVVELNEVAGRMLARPDRELVGSSFTAHLEPADGAVLRDVVADLVGGALAGWHGELRLRAPEEVRWIEVALSPLSAGDDMFVAQVLDVTARRAAEEQLIDQARRDSLTGLGNRGLLVERMEAALRTSRDEGRDVAVLFCDLDDFKHVNDSAGHTNGDLVLVEIAQRLTDLLAEGDVAARLGGDEFVLLRPTGGAPAAAELAGAVIAALEQPVLIAGQAFVVGSSIGIALGGPGAQAGDVLRDADAAMYAAKAGGKRRAVVFSEEHRDRARRAVRIESELRRAIADGELLVHLQPVVDVRTGRTVAAEALIRWQHPEQGLLAPAAWLDVAESAGLMPEIGAWVLRRSCELALDWPAADPRTAPAVHVNVSARQLDVPGFVDMVRDVLAATGLPPHRLVLEFTETQLDTVSAALLAELVGLRAQGIGLAADDFGTGYSPLTRIIELPLTMIKVDRRFVGAMLDDVRSRAIVTTLVRLSQSLGLELVAEGVETKEQADALRRLGCPTGQGYLWSRPVPAEEFRRRLDVDPRGEPA